MQLSKNALVVLKNRYLKKGEDGKVIEKPEDMFMRVAQTVAANEAGFVKNKKDAVKVVTETANAYYALMTSLEFLPNSPTLMNAGRELGQLSACFVLPVDDCIEDIFDAVKFTAMVHKSGGGTGFSFGRLRPSNDVVKTTMGVSSGPISFMKIFDTATEQIKQGGTRRGANMGILPVHHPDILDFIGCKDNNSALNNFNISVGLTRIFMDALEKEDDRYPLVNPRSGGTVGYLHARKVFEKIVAQAHKNGEPGIIFLDRMNEHNPTPHKGQIEATNPCGEQPLLPYESCNLGSINLGKMVKGGKVDWERLRQVTRLAAQFLDNVIDVNCYPLPQIAEMSKGNRKIGLGVMGWADMLVQLGIPYSSEEARDLGRRVMKFIREEAVKKSMELAEQRGVYPNWQGSVHQQQGIRLRNATVTTIAPTGTISIIADASSGVEPLFAVSYVRTVMDNDKLVEVNPLFEAIAKREGFYSEALMELIAEEGTVAHIDDVPEKWRRIFEVAHDVAPEQHVLMQTAFQEHTDNAVSKTVNLPHSATPEDVERIYRLAYKHGCKGITVYRDGSRDEQVLSTGKKTVTVDGKTLEVKAPKRERPKTLLGRTHQMETGCGPFYVTINEDEHGVFELFTTMGKAGGCAASQCEAIGRMVSMAWRNGVEAKQVIKQLLGISCHIPSGFGENRVLSCADAVAKAIQTHLQEQGVSLDEVEEGATRGACPECGGMVEPEGGCSVCRVCGYSQCN